MQEWTGVYINFACLSSVVLSRIRSGTGAAKPNIKVLHASCEFVAIVAGSSHLHKGDSDGRFPFLYLSLVNGRTGQVPP